MSGYPKNSKAQRVGLFLGRAYRGLLRQEHRLRLWLVRLGIPAPGARGLSWCLRFSVIVLLLSFSLVLGLIVCGLWLIGRGVAQSDLSYREPETEWRDGYAGFGLYTRDGFRIDPYVSEDD